jgi:hypothetical protein
MNGLFHLFLIATETKLEMKLVFSLLATLVLSNLMSQDRVQVHDNYSSNHY